LPRGARRAGMRRAARTGGCARTGEVGAGAEALAGGGEDDRPDVRILAAAGERGEVRLAHLRVHGVARLGTVEDDPPDAILDVELEQVGHGRSPSQPAVWP